MVLNAMIGCSLAVLAVSVAAAPALADGVCTPGGEIGLTCQGTEVVSFVPGDATAAIQAALDGTACNVIVPNVGEPWISGPLFIQRDGVTLIFEPGVELVGAFGAFPEQGDNLIRVRGASDVTICGYGATLRMQNGVDPAYLDGEWRHTIALIGAEDTTVQGLTLAESGGDGVYVTGNYLSGADHVPSRNITVRDCVFLDHRRQGISVISVDGLLVEDCLFRDVGATSGTDPMSGIDFEPDEPYHQIRGCVVRDCEFIDNRAGNYSSGIHMYFGLLDQTSQPIDVLIERCRITSRESDGNAVSLEGVGDYGPAVSIELRDSVIENVRGIGLYVLSPASNTQIKVTRTVLRSTHTDNAAWGGAPIYIEGQSGRMVAYGGITFEDVLIVDDKPRPFIKVYEDRDHIPLPPTYCDGLFGTVTVVNPFPEGHVFDLAGDNDVNVELEVTVGVEGDLDFNGTVDLADLNTVLAAFGESADGDADGDGDTDLADLNLVLARFGGA